MYKSKMFKYQVNKTIFKDLELKLKADFWSERTFHTRPTICIWSQAWLLQGSVDFTVNFMLNLW